eukprot:Skav209423  [mRNA]  locus=scaffold805:19309:34935:- [translate_table: standard]
MRHCWIGLRRFLLWASFDREEKEETSIVEGGCLHYEDRREASNEVALEGGEGDAVYFQRVRPGSQAEKAGVRVGDEVLQVNLIDPGVLFWRPAEEILPAIMGPILLQWRRRPAQKLGERTRINSRRQKLYYHDDEDGLIEVSEYPKSRAQTLGPGEWLCGSCEAKNFDSQEHCRVCGLRDSRLPVRPKRIPKLQKDPAHKSDAPHVAFGAVEVSKKDVSRARHGSA